MMQMAIEMKEMSRVAELLLLQPLVFYYARRAKPGCALVLKMAIAHNCTRTYVYLGAKLLHNQWNEVLSRVITIQTSSRLTRQSSSSQKKDGYKAYRQ